MSILEEILPVPLVKLVPAYPSFPVVFIFPKLVERRAFFFRHFSFCLLHLPRERIQ